VEEGPSPLVSGTPRSDTARLLVESSPAFPPAAGDGGRS